MIVNATRGFGIRQVGRPSIGLVRSSFRGPMPPITSGLLFFGDLSSSRTSIVSGAVATLGDSSGNGIDFTQGTAAARPTYTASDADFGGRPSMTFDGTNDALARAAFSFGGYSQATLYYVHRMTTVVPADQRVFSANVSANSVALVCNTSDFGAYFFNGAYTRKHLAISSATTYRVAIGINAATGATAIPEMYFNGASTGAYAETAATNGGPLATLTYAIGSDSAGANCAAMKMTDFLVYGGLHSAADIASIDAWLKWRNGL